MADPKGYLIVPVAFRTDGSLHALELNNSDHLKVEVTNTNLMETPHNLLDGAINQDTEAGTVLEGDLIVGIEVSAGVYKWKRLARGTTGQILRPQADNSLAWETVASGDYRLIESKNADSAAVSNFDFTSIPSTYSQLALYYTIRSNRSATNDAMRLRVNNDSGSNYDYVIFGFHHSALVASVEGLGQTSIISTYVCANTAVASDFSTGILYFPNYANTHFNKDFQTRSGLRLSASSGDLFLYDAYLHWRSTSAINQITLYPDAGTQFMQYSRANLYGIT